MRIKKLQGALRAKGIDLCLVSNLDERPNPNMRYLADYDGLGILAVMQKRHFLLAPEMEYEKALSTGIKAYKTDKKKRLVETLVTLLSRNKVKKVALDETSTSVHHYKRFRKAIKGRYVDASGMLARIRMIKEGSEIEKIKYACHFTDLIFSKIVRNFKFKTEQDVSNFILAETAKAKCEPAFPPIAASGKGSSQPHYNGNSRLKKGFLLLDFGVKYQGYCSDMTRMLYLGKPSASELKDYSLVKQIIDTIETASFRKFSAMYEQSVKILGDKSDYFIHALGHGLGLEIHEVPSLNGEDKTRTADDIAFTIEPGIYFPGRYGIRIEDTVVVKKGKIVCLTGSSKDLAIII